MCQHLSLFSAVRIPCFLKALPSHRKMAKISQIGVFGRNLQIWITNYCFWIYISVHEYIILYFLISLLLFPSVWPPSEFQFIMKFWMFYFSFFFSLVVVLILAFSDFSLHLFLCISLRQRAIPVALDGDGESCQQNFWCTCSKNPLPTDSGL